MLQDILGGRVQATFTALSTDGADQRRETAARWPLARMNAWSRCRMFRRSLRVVTRTSETSRWYGILVPAKTPKAIIDKLAAAADKALKSSGITAKFAKDDARAGGVPRAVHDVHSQGTSHLEAHHRKPGLKIE